MAMLVITRGYIFIAYASYIHNVFDAFPWKVWGIWRIIALPALSAFAMVQAFFAAAASARLPKVAVPQVRLCCLGSGSLAHSNMTNPQKHASYNIYIYIYHISSSLSFWTKLQTLSEFHWMHLTISRNMSDLKLLHTIVSMQFVFGTLGSI